MLPSEDYLPLTSGKKEYDLKKLTGRLWTLYWTREDAVPGYQHPLFRPLL